MEDEHLIVEMLQELQREIPKLSSKRIHQMLEPTFQAHGIKIGWNRLHEIRGKHKLLCKRKKRYINTTDSNHRFRKYPNKIKELEVGQPEQLWVSDITYIRIGEYFHFLSLVTDAYSRMIVGYCLFATLEAEGPLNALRMAISSLRKKPEGLIHHSDRGIQYCCDAYIEELQLYEIDISMAEKGDPYQNAIAERVNGILKDIYNLKRTFCNPQEAANAIEKAIYSYNHHRPHGSIENLTPAQAHQLTGKLRRTWKSKQPHKTSHHFSGPTLSG